jgi:hypothetical protein
MIQDDLAFGISSLRPIHGRCSKWTFVSKKFPFHYQTVANETSFLGHTPLTQQDSPVYLRILSYSNGEAAKAPQLLLKWECRGIYKFLK